MGSDDDAGQVAVEQSTEDAAPGAPPGRSLIFGGGGRFLSKYDSLPRSEAGRSQPRRRAGADPGAGASGKPGAAGGAKGGGVPAPDRVNVQLNSLLVHSRTTDRILQVVDEHFDEFNAVNLITALHRLATVVVAARKGALRRDSRFKRLVHQLSDTLRNSEPSLLKPQDLSNVAWALTKLGLLNAVLFGHLSVHIMRTVESFEPVNLSMTLWAFARSGFLDEKLFRAAAAEVKRQLPEFQPQQIANTTWAMAKSGFLDEELFNAAAKLALAKLSEFQPMNYSMLLYSFTLAKMPHEELFQRVGQRCTVQELTSAASAPNVVTNLALAFSDAGVVNDAVFEAVGQVASSTLYDFRTQQIATLVQAFARVGAKHERLFACVSQAVVNRLSEFKHHDLQDIMSAFEKSGVSTAAISRAIDAQQWHETRGGGGNTRLLLILAVLVVLTAFGAAWHWRPGLLG